MLVPKFVTPSYCGPLLLTLVVCVLLCAVPATAQEIGIVDQPSLTLDSLEGENEKELSIGTAFSLIPSSELSGSGGDVRALRTDVNLHYSIFSLAYGYSSYDWSSGTSMGPDGGSSNPWNSLHDVTLQARVLKGSYNDRWHYWVNAEATAAFEEIFPGALGAGFSGELAYDVWEGWMIGGLMRLTALNPLNQDLFADGELGVAVHVSQKHVRQALIALGLVEEKESTKDRYALRFAYSAMDRTYRLSPHSDFVRNGYVGIRRSKLAAYLDLDLENGFHMILGPEYHFNRQYAVYGSTGSRRSTTDIASSGGGYIGLNWTY
jgi:hypothetical protein